ncbi:hypothetical protein OC842_002992 [Tilletia horrida]|uniref:NDT80 domain-containing protein n=1 Tax=Tilletia horrida TaxID=155126 RepID=A0AAN6GC95_9BASI|nr:hypothetical protein OC842_002992 [Tilletia horrida]
MPYHSSSSSLSILSSPSFSSVSSASSYHSKPASSLQSTAQAPSAPSYSRAPPRLPPIHTWFRPGTQLSSTPSHLSTPLNQLKIAQPLLPWSSPLSASKSPSYLGFGSASTLPVSLASLLPVATQIPSQARPRTEQLYHSDSPSVQAAKGKGKDKRLSALSTEHLDRRVSSGETLPPTPPTTRQLPHQEERSKRCTASISASSTHPKTLTFSSGRSSNNVFANAQTRLQAECVLDGEAVNITIDATSHDCFTLVSDKWTCYRRNYLKIDAAVHCHPALTSKDSSRQSGPGPSSSSLPHKRSRNDTLRMPSSLISKHLLPVYVTLSAHVADHTGRPLPNKEEVSLVQFGPEREQGPRSALAPLLLLLDPSGSDSDATLSDDAAENWRRCQSASTGTQDGAWAEGEGEACHIASFRRVQIAHLTFLRLLGVLITPGTVQRRATTNNGRGNTKAASETKQTQQHEQQFFVLRISVYAHAEAEDGSEPASPPPMKRARRAIRTSSSHSSNGGHQHRHQPTLADDRSDLGGDRSGDASAYTTPPSMDMLLATLDSAPVTIRGRSRKHFVGIAASPSAAK